jgi:hypothetical protein
MQEHRRISGTGRLSKAITIMIASITVIMRHHAHPAGFLPNCKNIPAKYAMLRNSN